MITIDLHTIVLLFVGFALGRLIVSVFRLYYSRWDWDRIQRERRGWD